MEGPHMRKEWFVVGGVVMLAVSGCRSATRMVEYPRADLELPAGSNRGYLIGTPPAFAGAWKSTRQMVETEVEVPARAKRTGQAGAGSNEAAAQDGMVAESAWNASGASQDIIGNYTVKSNDPLWTIAADPTVYGNASKWQRLYNANRDVLKSPDRLRAGMTLKIPRAESAQERAAQTEPDGVYKK